MCLCVCVCGFISSFSKCLTFDHRCVNSSQKVDNHTRNFNVKIKDENSHVYRHASFILKFILHLSLFIFPSSQMEEK